MKNWGGEKDAWVMSVIIITRDILCHFITYLSFLFKCFKTTFRVLCAVSFPEWREISKVFCKQFKSVTWQFYFLFPFWNIFVHLFILSKWNCICIWGVRFPTIIINMQYRNNSHLCGDFISDIFYINLSSFYYYYVSHCNRSEQTGWEK